MEQPINNTQRSIKHYFILPSFQLRLIVFMTIVVLIGSIIHIAFLNYVTTKNLSESFSEKQIEQIWTTISPAITITNALSFVFISIFLIIVVILVTHKLIGPMLKATGYINKINSGMIPKDDLKFREGDEGLTLCEAINKMKSKLRAHYEQLESIKEKVKEPEVSSKLDRILEELHIEK